MSRMIGRTEPRAGTLARGQQAEQPPAFVDDDECADAGAAHGVACLGQRRARPNRVRIGDDAMLPPLDALDFAHLRLDITCAGVRAGPHTGHSVNLTRQTPC
jgi:hypothetical protein